MVGEWQQKRAFLGGQQPLAAVAVVLVLVVAEELEVVADFCTGWLVVRADIVRLSGLCVSVSMSGWLCGMYGWGCGGTHSGTQQTTHSVTRLHTRLLRRGTERGDGGLFE